MRKTITDDDYFRQNHSYLIKKLYDQTEAEILAREENSFLKDVYPDPLSLQLFREKILTNNPEITSSFLQPGCPMEWIREIADLILAHTLTKHRLTLEPGPVVSFTEPSPET